MEKRSEIKRQAPRSNRTFILVLLGAVFVSAAAILFFQSIMGLPKGSGRNAAKDTPKSSSVAGKKTDSKTVRIMANGDLLYHDGLYMSAQKADGSYDFSENFTYVKDWLQQGDLVLGDFEGTIRSDYPLGGYPLFNAPEAVVPAIKDAGYQVVDLAHNHILDSGLEGVFTTAKAFEDHGISPVGVYTHKNRDKSPILIKEVKGIFLWF